MRKGYTLIEILVGLAIISLLFSFGYVSFRDFSRRQALNGSVKQIQGDLRLAQSSASSGQKPSSGNCTQLDGYTVNFSTDNYVVTANCTNQNITIKTVTLPTGITETVGSVRFKVLGQGTNLADGVDTTITVTQNGTNATAVVTITSGGEIK